MIIITATFTITGPIMVNLSPPSGYFTNESRDGLIDLIWFDFELKWCIYGLNNFAPTDFEYSRCTEKVIRKGEKTTINLQLSKLVQPNFAQSRFSFGVINCFIHT